MGPATDPHCVSNALPEHTGQESVRGALGCARRVLQEPSPREGQVYALDARLECMGPVAAQTALHRAWRALQGLFPREGRVCALGARLVCLERAMVRPVLAHACRALLARSQREERACALRALQGGTKRELARVNVLPVLLDRTERVGVRPAVSSALQDRTRQDWAATAPRPVRGVRRGLSPLEELAHAQGAWLDGSGRQLLRTALHRARRAQLEPSPREGRARALGASLERLRRATA
mmetsp:Transcript_53236/g.140866  ORF Transcript_53236/g.140866 Transcript_53236/m.140866 type:complete len:238 (-) Transcript_53236:1183-1896(-)